MTTKVRIALILTAGIKVKDTACPIVFHFQTQSKDVEEAYM